MNRTVCREFETAPGKRTSPRYDIILNVPNGVTNSSRLDQKNLVRRLVREHGVSRFLCTSNDFLHFNEILQASFDVNDRSLYRLDFLDGKDQINIGTQEIAAGFYRGDVDFHRLEINQGESVLHFFCEGSKQCDQAGRLPLEHHNASKIWHSPEHWLSMR